MVRRWKRQRRSVGGGRRKTSRVSAVDTANAGMQIVTGVWHDGTAKTDSSVSFLAGEIRRTGGHRGHRGRPDQDDETKFANTLHEGHPAIIIPWGRLRVKARGWVRPFASATGCLGGSTMSEQPRILWRYFVGLTVV